MQEKELMQIVRSAVADAVPPRMSLRIAAELIRRVEEKAAQIGVAAVIAVSNEGARPVAVHCMDSSYIASYDVALHKSYTVAALKMSTLELKTLTQPGGPLYGIQYTNEGKIIIFGGGVPLWYKGHLIGGLGVSGGTEEQDSLLAEYGGQCLEEVMK